MANSRQALKRARQARKHYLNNSSRKSSMRTAIKRVLYLINSGEKAQQEALSLALQKAIVIIDRSAGDGLIHVNKAARLKHRLNKKVRLFQQETN